MRRRPSFSTAEKLLDDLIGAQNAGDKVAIQKAKDNARSYLLLRRSKVLADTEAWAKELLDSSDPP